MAFGSEDTDPEQGADQGGLGGESLGMPAGMMQGGVPQPPPGPPPVGPGRHLLTGLVGVLIDGLQAGVQTPQSGQGFSQSAARAAQMPQERQQQQMAQETAKGQHELQMAQMHIQMQQIKHMAAKLSDEDLENLTDNQKAMVSQAIKDEGISLLSTATDRTAASDKVSELQRQDHEQALNYMSLIASHDAQGNPVWGVYQLRPKNTLSADQDFPISGSEKLGVPDDKFEGKAGMPWGDVMKGVFYKQRGVSAKVDAAKALQIAEDKPDATQVIQNVVGGKPHNILVNKRTGEQIKDLGEATVKAGATGDKETDDSYKLQIKRLDSTRKPIDESAARLARLGSSLNMRTPQADAEIAPQLMVAMAGGQGSGVRITQAEIDRTEGGRSGWENLNAKLQHWNTDPSKALSLTDSQRNQMRQLVKMVNDKVTGKQAILNTTETQLSDPTLNKTDHKRVMADLHKQLEAVDSGKFPDRETANAVRKATQPMFAKNPKTGERVQSRDGGKTWQPAQ
jgi:hypothetical protein